MGVQRRKVQDRAEAESLLASLRESEQSLRQLCHERGIDARSLHCWRLNLSASSRSRETDALPRLVELVPVPRSPRSARPPRRYLVHGDGLTVELGDDFDDATVGRLLALVRAC